MLVLCICALIIRLRALGLMVCNDDRHLEVLHVLLIACSFLIAKLLSTLPNITNLASMYRNQGGGKRPKSWRYK
jgi:hypothetical protein